MHEGVQFEDSRKHSHVQDGENKLINWLIDNNLAKDEKSATRSVSLVIIVLLIVTVSVPFISRQGSGSVIDPSDPDYPPPAIN